MSRRQGKVLSPHKCTLARSFHGSCVTSSRRQGRIRRRQHASSLRVCHAHVGRTAARTLCITAVLCNVHPAPPCPWRAFLLQNGAVCAAPLPVPMAWSSPTVCAALPCLECLSSNARAKASARLLHPADLLPAARGCVFMSSRAPSFAPLHARSPGPAGGAVGYR